MRFKGRFFDGRTAHPTLVDVLISDQGITIESQDEHRLIARWNGPTVSVAFRATNGRRVDLSCSDTPDARLMVEGDGVLDALAPYLPELTRTARSEWGVGLKISAALVSGVVAVLVVLTLFAEAIVTSFPASWERDLGRTYAEGSVVNFVMGGAVCTSQAGARALDRMTARLTDGLDLRHPLNVQVIDNSLVNAFALPGGFIRIHRGLIEEVDNPDALAGVLAHEIGHVQDQHSLRTLARSLLVVAAVEAITGGTGLSAIFIDLGNLHYGRGLEEEADQFAIDRMIAVGLDPADMALFFEDLQQKGRGGGKSTLDELLSSHPLTADRLARLKAASVPRTSPSLTDREWRDLKAICAVDES